MSDFIEKLVSNLEPTIVDLDEKINELNLHSEELLHVSNLLDYINDSEKDVVNYSNQQFILDRLNDFGSDASEYNACCYLINSESENVMNLPQYIKSKEYFRNMINYFKSKKEELELVVHNLEIECDIKKVNKKYYDIFNNDVPFVEDVLEFNEFIDRQELMDEDKIKILSYVIKNNILKYKERV